MILIEGSLIDFDILLHPLLHTHLAAIAQTGVAQLSGVKHL